MDCLTSNTELSFPALMKRAELELGETPARRAKALTELKDLIKAYASCGVYLVIDFKGCSFQQVLHILSIKFLTTLFRYLQECWPCRLKGLHIIYEPLAVHYAYRIIKFFLSKKMKERFFMHGSDMTSLHKHIPRDTLPQDCGGTGEHANEDEFRTLILNHQSYIQKLNQYGFKINSVHT
ncbi:alpha-tocopherol transfer protein-like [Stegodyphus dumicola]|uniref:alpha-tocopherol transfer protein-like n=1 Tax=Stegodyphus dumicola TaxID=202533 RepID=UPI0015AF5B88|nr:alpha-tocopherol transfer protein-like [Stegodyphus dumicola]